MEIREITQYIFLDDEDLNADLAFVFGNWNAWKEAVERTVGLYKAGLISRIIVSGGINPRAGIVEGDLIAGELEKAGIPVEDILIENKSTNTLENVLFSFKVNTSQLCCEI